MSAVAGFIDTWRRVVERDPERTALVVADTGERTTYALLDAEAAAVGGRLADAGVTRGDLVAVRTADRRQFCVALLGCWSAGAVPVPLSARAPAAYIDNVARRVGATISLTVDDTAPGGLRPLGAPSRDPHGALDLAYVMHTSGSTGRPKPVALSHRALAAYRTAFTAATRLHSGDRFLQVAPVTFDVVFEELLPVWGVGGAVVLAPDVPEEPRLLLAHVERHGVTVAELTTVYWRLMVRHLQVAGAAVPDRLRLLLVGGEMATAGLIRDSLALGLPIAHVYGVTEAGITSTIEFFDRADPPGKPGGVPVGPPLANSTVHVVDAAGRPCPPGRVGEVWLGGDSLAEGYLGDPAATAAQFVTEPGGALPAGRYYRTGDAGRLSRSGSLEVLGRLDDEVKVNGVRVDLTELEAALHAVSGTTAAAVVAVPDDGAHRLHGFVVPAQGAPPPGAVRRLLAERLPPPLVPDSVIHVGAIPVTEHGKVDRAALASRIAAGHRDRPADADAGTASQRVVLAAWTAAVGRPPADLDQNFADAGGDSLALLELVTRLGGASVAVTGVDCLAHPTVRALAAFLDGDAALAPNAGAGTDDGSRQRAVRRDRHLRRRRAAGRNPT